MNTILTGDCLQVMPTFPANSVDSVICDPPYGLDFMGKSWDHGVPGVEFWQAALRVAKPGAILMAFGGTRTYHRLTCAIEDAGWEIRDGMCWLYGSGFPKSLDISKAIDKAAGAEREVIGSKGLHKFNTTRADKNHGEYGLDSRTFEEADVLTAPSTPAAHLWQGYGTALKPAWEPIIVAMKPLEGTYAENAQKWGVAGLNIDGGRIGTDEVFTSAHKTLGDGIKYGKSKPFPASEMRTGRWPANLLLDEEAARLLDEQSGESTTKRIEKPSDCQTDGNTSFDSMRGNRPARGYDSFGGASRFFYTAKASSSERNAGLEDMPVVDANKWNGGGIGERERQAGRGFCQNFHPTVKPVSLMRYLCKLTRTPTGGVVLDPFMGSGTTGVACILEHRDFIGIEIDAQYAEIARKRIADMTGPLFVTA